MDKTKWKCDKLDNIANILNGYAFKSNFYCNHGIRIIRITNVQDGYIDDTEPKFYPLSFNKEISKYLLYENDLLISLTGNVGRVAFLPKQMLPAALNQRVACIRLKNDKVISLKFLYHFMMNIKFKDDCIRNSKGVAQLNMSTEWLKSYNITFPPLSEQRGIASELDAVQIMIDGYKAQLADLDALAQSIFFDMFGDPISNPKEWKTDKLVNLVSKDCPITYGIVQPGEDVCNGIPIVRPVDLLSTFISKCSLKKVSKDISDTYKRTILKGDEVLMCVRGTTGIVSLARNDLAGCNVTRGIVPLSFDKISRWFAYWCIKSPQMNFIIQKYTKGATLKQINIKDVRNLVFPVPPFALQQRFAAKIEAIEKQKELLRQQLSDAETLMAERMQYYFS